MEIRELRQGNYILYADEVVEVIGYRPPIRLETKYRVYFKDGRAKVGFMKPIPLTEEWLLKLGFKKNDRNEYLKEAPGWKKYYKVYYEKYIATGEHAEGWLLQCVYAGSGMRKEEKIDIPCGYLSAVHQLQNLYFALTGEELTVK